MLTRNRRTGTSCWFSHILPTNREGWCQFDKPVFRMDNRDITLRGQLCAKMLLEHAPLLIASL